jgi:hypothetical protein
MRSIAIVATIALFAGAAPAMEIPQFDRMATSDQGAYIAFLIASAQQALKDERRDDLAAQVRKLFTVRHPGDTLSVGMQTLETNLAHARAVDAQTHAQDPQAERLDVEQALIVTLKWQGINLPKRFRQATARFKPKHRQK